MNSPKPEKNSEAPQQVPQVFRADLHCHSSFSDGTDSPEQLIQLAIEQGLSGLSITDHDTVLSYVEALAYAKLKNFPVISGVEFSAVHRQEPVHILGYGYDLRSQAIIELCQRQSQRRKMRNERILEKLKVLGIVIEAEELAQVSLKGSCGRPHIAFILLNRGVVRSIQEAFERYLGEGKPAYDPGDPISVEETISIIQEGKGKAVLAHPHLIKKSTTVRTLLQMPFDGIECYYARFNSGQEKKWVDIARQKKWLMTGGSDYHGATKPFNQLGTSWVGKETFDFLYSHFLRNNNF